MNQGLVTVLVVIVAVVVGQQYPAIGGIIAMFPTKMIAYVVASEPSNVTEGVWGLLTGSISTAACAVVMWVMLPHGLTAAVIAGLITWSAVAVIMQI